MILATLLATIIPGSGNDANASSMMITATFLGERKDYSRYRYDTALGTDWAYIPLHSLMAGHKVAFSEDYLIPDYISRSMPFSEDFHIDVLRFTLFISAWR